MEPPDRIVIDSAVAHGKPVVRGTRVPVAIVVGSVAAGMSFEDVQHEYDLTIDEIQAALKIADDLSRSSHYAQIICKNLGLLSSFAYDLGVASLDQFIDDQLIRGRAYFTSEDLQAAFDLKPQALAAAITRQIKKRRIANPRHGFFLILRPEDQPVGAPDPAQWIDPLMKYQGLDYRVSLLRAAAFHGTSHQAAMVFQVVVPKQLRDFEVGRHRLEFLFQTPQSFAQANQPDVLAQLKSDAGYANVGGVELTLLDCVRYFHKAGGINGVAQIVQDIGHEANPRKLARVATAYENSSVRRLGYLLDRAGHIRQSKILEPFVKKAKASAPLDPAVKPLTAFRVDTREKNAKWKLAINVPVEVDF